MMASSSPTLSGKKRIASLAQTISMCSFCGKAPAAISVELKSTRGKAKPTPLCMLHYYTTRAVRQEPSVTTVLHQDLVDTQLQEFGLQEAFAQAFSELQQELAHESARALSNHGADPLSIVGQLRGRPKRAAPIKSVAAGIARPPKPQQQTPEGGFIRQVPLPERLVRTQQEQARLQQEQASRMTARLPTGGKNHNATQVNPYERRKPSRRSIWHLAMQEPTKEEEAILASGRADNDELEQKPSGETCSSCGSSKVYSTGHSANRNSDMTKGETWGNKDRAESLISRYQCQACGRIWNQEE